MLESLSKRSQELAIERAAAMAETMSGRAPREVISLRPHESISGDVRGLLSVRSVDPKSPVWELISNTSSYPPGVLEIDKEELMKLLRLCTGLTRDRLTRGVITVRTSPVGQTVMFTEKRSDWFGIQPVSLLLSGNYVTPQAICFSSPEISELMALRWKFQANTQPPQILGQARLL